MSLLCIVRLVLMGFALTGGAFAAGLTVFVYAPEGAVVSVVGVSYGSGSMRIEGLPLGSHTLEVVLPGGSRVQRALIQQDVWTVEKRIDVRVSVSQEGQTSVIEGPGGNVLQNARRLEPSRRRPEAIASDKSRKLGRPCVARLPDGTEAIVYPVQKDGQ